MAVDSQVDTVMFSGSSLEDIERAKTFWKAIDPPSKPNGTLVVTGIDQRLPTAPKTKNSKSEYVDFTLIPRLYSIYGNNNYKQEFGFSIENKN